MRLGAAAGGVMLLSAFPHQEARFLIPAVPLMLSATKVPNVNKTFGKIWWTIWVVWNLFMGILMGSYHQGGVVPMQLHIAAASSSFAAMAGIEAASQVKRKVIWWKTYMTPIWLLDGQIGRIETIDMMGAPFENLTSTLDAQVPACRKWIKGENVIVELVAPFSATILDSMINAAENSDLILKESWRYNKHLSLDDLDIPSDGIWGTIKKLWEKRGLVLYRVERKC
jgi:GPI mannosyltransferase 4